MEKAAAELVAISEAVVFLHYFKDLQDPRQPGKVVYPLDEVLLFCLLAVLGGAETFVDIARFGQKKLGLLRRFRPFRDGTPSHDHLGNIFARLDVAIPALLRGLGCGADRRTGGCDRRRRQDLAPLLPEEGRESADPHGFGLRGRASAWCSDTKWRRSRTRSSRSRRSSP